MGSRNKHFHKRQMAKEAERQMAKEAERQRAGSFHRRNLLRDQLQNMRVQQEKIKNRKTFFGDGNAKPTLVLANGEPPDSDLRIRLDRIIKDQAMIKKHSR